MSSPLERAKQVILAELAKLPPGAIELEIVSSPGSVSYFRRALELVEIQRQLNRRRLRTTIRIPEPPIEQAKKHILKILREASPEIRTIAYPTKPEDAADYRAALRLPEVQEEFRIRNVQGIVQPIGFEEPQIIIATYEDVMSGRLDNFFGGS